MKSITLRKAVCILVSIMILTSLFVGCGSQAGSNNETTAAAETTKAAETTQAAPAGPAYLSDTSPVTLEWYVDDPLFSRVKWGQDAMSQYVTKKTGVTLNLIVPSGDLDQVKNVMIASNEIPDLISMGNWLPHWRTMAENGQLWELKEMSDKYHPEFFSDTSVPGTGVPKSSLEWYKTDKGYFVFPAHNQPTELFSPENKTLITSIGFSVRKDMYEAIGKPDMSQPEGWLAALQKVKEMYPKVDGQPLIPYLIGAEFNAQGNSFLHDGLGYLVNAPLELADGTYNKHARIFDPEVVRWVKTIRKAKELGLIDLDQLTDKGAQINEKRISGRVFATTHALNSMTNTVNGTMFQKDPNSIFTAIDAMKNTKNEAPKLKAGGMSGWLVTGIGKSTKVPDRAIKFLNYIISEEGQSDIYFGDETMYDVVDGKKVPKKEIWDLRNTDEATYCSKYGGRDAYCMINLSGYTGKWDLPMPDFRKVNYDWASDKNTDFSEVDSTDPDPASEAGIAFDKFRAKQGELLPKMILAKSDEELDRLMGDLKAIYDETSKAFLPVMQAKYEANKVKLGKK